MIFGKTLFRLISGVFFLFANWIQFEIGGGGWEFPQVQDPRRIQQHWNIVDYSNPMIRFFINYYFKTDCNTELIKMYTLKPLESYKNCLKLPITLVFFLLFLFSLGNPLRNLVPKFLQLISIRNLSWVWFLVRVELVYYPAIPKRTNVCSGAYQDMNLEGGRS